MTSANLQSLTRNRRWVIQELDETGGIIAELPLTARQTQLAYAAAAAEGHGVALAPRRLRALFSESEWAFLERHYFQMVQIGLFNGAYWFDEEDARAWRTAFNRQPPAVLEMAFQVYHPNPVWPVTRTRFGWEHLFVRSAEERSSFGLLLDLADELAQRGGCWYSVDPNGRRHKYYEEKPPESEFRAELSAGRTIEYWSAV